MLSRPEALRPRPRPSKIGLEKSQDQERSQNFKETLHIYLANELIVEAAGKAKVKINK